MSIVIVIVIVIVVVVVVVVEILPDKYCFRHIKSQQTL
jgi:hypothetical protein